jgi:hypothetical protein
MFTYKTLLTATHLVLVLDIYVFNLILNSEN